MNSGGDAFRFNKRALIGGNGGGSGSSSSEISSNFRRNLREGEDGRRYLLWRKITGK